MISPQLSLLFVQSVIVSFLMFSLMACEQNSAVSSASQPKQTLQSSQQEQVMPEITPENEQEASEFSTEHWDTVKTAKYNQIVNNQLAMNAVIWQNLQEKGVMETTELRLDFFYYAPDKESAELLYQFLGRETDYELQDISYNSSSRDWSINGTTQATTVSKEILDQWVGYMVAVGVEYNSTFDGWGTVVP